MQSFPLFKAPLIFALAYSLLLYSFWYSKLAHLQPVFQTQDIKIYSSEIITDNRVGNSNSSLTHPKINQSPDRRIRISAAIRGAVRIWRISTDYRRGQLSPTGRRMGQFCSFVQNNNSVMHDSEFSLDIPNAALKPLLSWVHKLSMILMRMRSDSPCT